VQGELHRPQDEVYTIHMVSEYTHSRRSCSVKNSSFRLYNLFLSRLIAAIDRTRIHRRGASPRTSERGRRVRAGCSLLLNPVASCRTLHPIRSARRSALRVSTITLIMIMIVTRSSASTNDCGATATKGVRATRRPPRHPRSRVSKC